MSDKFDAILQTASLIPPIPKVIQDLLLLLNKVDLSIHDLADVVRLDPVISMKVLKLANSAFFGRTKQVGSIEDAAFVIGIDSIRTMVLAFGMMGTWPQSPNFNLERFWRLTLLSACVAKDISKLCGHNPDRAYTAGLLHGLGILAIQRAIPDIAVEIDKTCEDHSPYDRADTETELLGFDHAEVGAAIVEQWKLPREVGDAVLHYPHPGASHSRELCALIHLAVALAINMSDGIPADQWQYNLDVDVEELLDIVMAELPKLQAKFDASQRFVNVVVSSH